MTAQFHRTCYCYYTWHTVAHIFTTALLNIEQKTSFFIISKRSKQKSIFVRTFQQIDKSSSFRIYSLRVDFYCTAECNWCIELTERKKTEELFKKKTNGWTENTRERERALLNDLRQTVLVFVCLWSTPAVSHHMLLQGNFCFCFCTLHTFSSIHFSLKETESLKCVLLESKYETSEFQKNREVCL